jgi:hypothetical protein
MSANGAFAEFELFSLPTLDAKDNQNTSGHILSEVISSTTADDQDWFPDAVFLHVDAGTITHTVADKYAPATHGVAKNIAPASVNDQAAGVHGVCHAILNVAVDHNIYSIHKSTQIVAGNAVYLYRNFVAHPITYVTMSADVIEDYLRLSPGYGLPDKTVQFFIMKAFRV